LVIENAMSHSCTTVTRSREDVLHRRVVCSRSCAAIVGSQRRQRMSWSCRDGRRRSGGAQLGKTRALRAGRRWGCQGNRYEITFPDRGGVRPGALVFGVLRAYGRRPTGGFARGRLLARSGGSASHCAGATGACMGSPCSRLPARAGGRSSRGYSCRWRSELFTCYWCLSQRVQ
jgi:hypothetical protein